MGDAIGETLGYAVGIAVSPIPIAAVILMLFSSRARSNSLSFMVAWIAGIAW
ncbi:MAG: GAP family protein [Acidimicrobiales bacterium]